MQVCRTSQTMLISITWYWEVYSLKYLAFYKYLKSNQWFLSRIIIKKVCFIALTYIFHCNKTMFTDFYTKSLKIFPQKTFILWLIIWKQCFISFIHHPFHFILRFTFEDITCFSKLGNGTDDQIFNPTFNSFVCYWAEVPLKYLQLSSKTVEIICIAISIWSLSCL